jgi:hypothetical protein
MNAGFIKAKLIAFNKTMRVVRVCVTPIFIFMNAPCGISPHMLLMRTTLVLDQLL